MGGECIVLRMSVENAIVPDAVKQSADGSAITLVYGVEAISISAASLWTQCRSAAALAATLSGVRKHPPDGLRVTEMKPVGLYGLNIAFSDGSDRGIYPWALLRAIAASQGEETAPRNAPLDSSEEFVREH